MADPVTSADDNPEFEEAFGLYVGPADYDDVIEALKNVPPMSELVVRIDNRESVGADKSVSYKHGYPSLYRVDDGDDDEGRELLVVAEVEQALGWGAMTPDPSFTLWLTDHRLDADRFSGGVRLRSVFGTVVDIAVWHGTLHLTETGDVAPGFGPAQMTVTDEDEEVES